MISISELSEDFKNKLLDNLYLEECSNIEKRIDNCIREGFALGLSVYNTSVHDTEKKHPKSFIDTINKYKDDGWDITFNKPWSALFYEIIIKKN